jgi:serine phosphatase RsbU (regulator of sigma subunit)
MVDHPSKQVLPPLRLEPLAGPHVPAIVATVEEGLVIGRSSQADVQLTDQTISRRHCHLSVRAGTWLITDLGSRHGTYLNGITLAAEQPSPIHDGDMVRLGPWTFRTRIGLGQGTGVFTTNDLGSTSMRVQTVPQQELRSLAQQRLELLIECAASINTAHDEKSLARTVIDVVTRGTGFNRAAVIRQLQGDEIEVVAHVAAGEQSGTGMMFSQSLIRAASGGQIVRLSGESVANYGQSIMDLGIHSALCAPISIGTTVAAYLYLDARRQEDRVSADAAAFCQAVGRLTGLALSNLKRLDLEKRQLQLETDLNAARKAQQLLMPPASGELDGVQYAVVMRPGRYVAGDLFDVVPLSDGRVAVFLGDVSGKGVGAAILMTSAQTFLRLSLQQTGDPAQAVRMTNRHVAERAGEGRFISMWVGVIDAKAGTVTFIDAGHGHWLVRPTDGPPCTVEAHGGMLIGIDPDAVYENEVLELPAGSRLVLYSDGVYEQRDPQGDEFGMERIVEALSETESPSRDVDSLFGAVVGFAAGASLADDVTVASVRIG